uniref:Uncharacterized protein n=1 Tax=Arundo donax TaxID=35708 RepID=A0A0A9FI38_ARUDO
MNRKVHDLSNGLTLHTRTLCSMKLFSLLITSIIKAGNSEDLTFF